MRIGCITTQQNNNNIQTFKGLSIKKQNLAELMESGSNIVNRCFEQAHGNEYLQGYYPFVKNFQHQHAKENLNSLCPRSRTFADKILSLSRYENMEQLSESFLYYKPKELEDLYNIISKRDISGQIRCPSDSMSLFLRITPERLQVIKPIILAKNDLGLWNYSEKFISDLNQCSDKQLEVMSKLTSCNIYANSLFDIASNPNLNWDKTVERARSLKTLFGKDLREVNFFSNRKGENYLSADVQLPHNPDKPDYLNFQRLYARLDEDVNPLERMNTRTNVKQYAKNIYAKIENKMCLLKEKDLDRIIVNIQNDIPGATQHEILSVMQRLTQFANYSCLTPLAKKLEELNIGQISNKGDLNSIFNYLGNSKNLFDLKTVNKLNIGFIVDKNEFLNPSAVAALRGGGGPQQVSFINLEGWHDGVNLLNDDKKLESATKNILIKAKKILANNKYLTIDEAISDVLNTKVEKQFKDAGVNLITVRLDPAPPTKAVVLEQMRPYMPTESILTSTIESIAKNYSKTNKEFISLSGLVAKYYDDNLNVFSKQTIIENLKIINKSINKYLKEKNLTRKNLYILRQEAYEDRVKSFDLITKMYVDLFNLPAERNIKVNNIEQINSFPPNSTFLIVDDVVGSGSSMSEVGEYMFTARKIAKDKHVLFCPITATQKGVHYLQHIIDISGRKDSDAILNISENTKTYKNILKDLEDTNQPYMVRKLFSNSGFAESNMCTAFPYMTPDNNSELASYLTKFFTPNIKCIKNHNELLPVIEQEILYYDIFGTSKANVLTDGAIVYGLKPENSAIKILKNFFKGGNS